MIRKLILVSTIIALAAGCAADIDEVGSSDAELGGWTCPDRAEVSKWAAADEDLLAVICQPSAPLIIERAAPGRVRLFSEDRPQDFVDFSAFEADILASFLAAVSLGGETESGLSVAALVDSALWEIDPELVKFARQGRRWNVVGYEELAVLRELLDKGLLGMHMMDQLQQRMIEIFDLNRVHLPGLVKLLYKIGKAFKEESDNIQRTREGDPNAPYRDSDGDGYINREDRYPNDPNQHICSWCFDSVYMDVVMQHVDVAGLYTRSSLVQTAEPVQMLNFKSPVL